MQRMPLRNDALNVACGGLTARYTVLHSCAAFGLVGVRGAAPKGAS